MKNVIMITKATPKDILELSDRLESDFIYKSAFLKPHLAKNHLLGQNPVHTPTFSINVTKITTLQDSKK
jgi:hypothetical protein